MKNPLSGKVLVLICVAMLLVACREQAPTKVLVALDATYPPFEIMDEGTKQIIGFDVDLIKAIAAKENLDIELVDVRWDPLLEGMAQCTYDAAISAMTINEERKKSFNFSEPYFAAGQVVTVRSDNSDITGKDALTGKKIGVQQATMGEIEARKIADSVVENYNDIKLAFQDLLDGKIDAVITDNLPTLEYIGQSAGELKTVGEVFTEEFYGIAVCNTNTDLLVKLNSGLAKVKAEGLIDQLSKKWFEGQK